MASPITNVLEQLFPKGHKASLSELFEFQPKDLNLPLAWAGHLPFAYWLIQALTPQTFVELGTHTGNSYLTFCQSISKHNTNTKAFAVDTWSGDEHSGLYGNDVYLEVEARNKKYSSFSTLLRSTFDEALNSFPEESIDLLHIDGLHTFEAVKHDFESWLPKMSSGGVILLHDITVFERGFGVHELWETLSSEYSSFEFRHSNGLGVIQLPGIIPSIVDSLEVNADAARGMFSKLGDALTKSLELQLLEDKIQDLDLDNKALRNELALIFDSKSWKYTTPLRRLLAVAKGRRSDY